MSRMLLGYRLLCDECGDKTNTWFLKEDEKITQRESFEGIDREVVNVKHRDHRFVKLNFRARTIEGLWKKIDNSEEELKRLFAIEYGKVDYE